MHCSKAEAGGNNADQALDSEASTSLPTVLVVFGTRPEAIKLAPVIRALQSSQTVNVLSVVTGQHSTLVRQVTTVFDVKPDYDLKLFHKNSGLNDFSAELIPEIDSIFSLVRPSAVLVQGDTTTASIAGVAAFHRQIPVIHLEAGLRSHDIASPFPEEGNRRILSHISSLNLCPSKRAYANLINEGIEERYCAIVGNTVIDALLSALNADVPTMNEQVNNVLSTESKIILVTAHRRENWGAPLHRIGRAIRDIANKYPEHTIVLPVHGNPLIRSTFEPYLANSSNVIMTSALGYIDFARLLNSTLLVLTDSGGVQEEAPALGKPVLVLRDTTERVEALEAGIIRLVGTQESNIVSAVSQLLDSPAAYARMASKSNPYGNGNAAQECVQHIESLILSI